MSLLWKTAVDASEGPYYHGTVEEFHPGDVISPAEDRTGYTNYPGQSDSRYSYATEDHDSAWDYAEKSWHAADGDSGHPRVYRVSPLGRHSKDPEYDKRGKHRGNWSYDRRSKHGWKVEEELPMPEHMGTPEDWR
jgi:hypothetical protein